MKTLQVVFFVLLVALATKSLAQEKAPQQRRARQTANLAKASISTSTRPAKSGNRWD